MSERPEPNNGVFYAPVYRGGALVPSSTIRRVIRSADARAARWERLGSWLGLIGVTL